jgi:hypothetical protein
MAAAFVSPTMPRTWPDSLITASRQEGQSCSVTLRRSCSYMTSFIRDTGIALPQRSPTFPPVGPFNSTFGAYATDLFLGGLLTSSAWLAIAPPPCIGVSDDRPSEMVSH